MGRVVFWLAWPFWFVYFRVVSNRTRVVIVVDGELLLVRTWLGANSWGLPGGGAHRGESLEQAACRELAEEVGVVADPTRLSFVASNEHKERGLRYTAQYFVLKLDSKPSLQLQKQEIAEAGWFDKTELSDLDLNKDTMFVVDKHMELL